MLVIGAGMAGLLAAGMLRNECSSVLEAQSSLPNNHSAVLRFRSSIVGDTLNIPFRQVRVMKAVAPWRNPIADALSYSRKSNGTSSLRSIISASGEIEERYIAPPNLVQLMAERLPNGKIAYDCHFNPLEYTGNEAVISTLPMPTLMELLDYPHRPAFGHVEGININCELRNTDTFATLYVPDPDLPFNRLSITGSKLTIEMAYPGCAPSHITDRMEELGPGRVLKRDIVHTALHLIGISPSLVSGVPEVSRQPYAKILPIDNDERKKFIMWATERHNIYSFGRYATWRPGLLLDDLVNDFRVIQKVKKSGSYEERKR
jgi:hypothetical protein